MLSLVKKQFPLLQKHKQFLNETNEKIYNLLKEADDARDQLENKEVFVKSIDFCKELLSRILHSLSL
jgi:hypothetical protein